MKQLKLLLLVLAACSPPTLCFGQGYGQGGWLDFASAIPKVLNPGGTPNFNTSVQGFPSTSGVSSVPFSSATAYNPANSNGFNQGGFGAGPMLSPARKDWKLGVYVQNTDSGAVVTQVAPGSAGQQAGLQPGDIIVAVGGSRIGSFDNRIVELAEEIRRYTDPMGRVSILVFNARQRTIVALPISMNSTSSTLTGTVSTRDRSQLPYGSTLVVQLQNVSKPYYIIDGGKSATRADGNGPFGFELHFEPRYVDPADQYQLTASITIGNQLMYYLPQPIPVDVRNLGLPVNLLVEQASGGQSLGNPGQPNYNGGNPANVINVNYPGSLGPNAVNDLFIQLLGQPPSAKEVVAWQSYLSQGNSINDLKVKLLSSPRFRERFQYNDGAYVQQLVTSLTNQVPNQQEVAYWSTRLQATGSAELTINEILMKNR
jgi:uncharacterized lipoprotein YbaY